LNPETQENIKHLEDELKEAKILVTASSLILEVHLPQMYQEECCRLGQHSHG